MMAFSARGQGQGRGRGDGEGKGGRRMGGSGAGTGGECVCPACGAVAPHDRGVPCMSIKCPKCGKTMTRR